MAIFVFNEVCGARGRALFSHPCVRVFTCKCVSITHHMTTGGGAPGASEATRLPREELGAIEPRGLHSNRPQVETADVVPQGSFALVINKGNL